MNTDENDSCCRLAGPIGAAIGALLLLRLPFVRALPGLVIGLALALVKPALLVLGIAKLVECARRREGISDS